MLRVTTLHASSAAATAAYYAQYLTAAPGEVPGVWSGRQAASLGLSGRVEVDALESVWWALTGDRRLLEAHDVAISSALAHLERFGSTTRIRSNGGRVHRTRMG